MKSIARWAILFCVGCALSGPPLSAQPGRRSSGMPRYYDSSAETTVTGTVEQVQHYQRGRLPAIHLILKSGAETFDVLLGPAAYISDRGFTFAKGDTVQVLGAKLTAGTTPAIIAREVTKDGKKLTLRDATGRPLWARAPRVTG